VVSQLLVSDPVRVKTVQVAIPDPGYADSIRNLLVQDGRHQVHLVEKPDFGLNGVIIIDARQLVDCPSLRKEQKRLVAMASKTGDDLEKMWDAGIRHLLFYEDPPERLRILVLAVELKLAANPVIRD
jgi:hypothetical protein